MLLMQTFHISPRISINTTLYIAPTVRLSVIWPDAAVAQRRGA